MPTEAELAQVRAQEQIVEVLRDIASTLRAIEAIIGRYEETRP